MPHVNSMVTSVCIMIDNYVFICIQLHYPIIAIEMSVEINHE